MEEEKIDYHSSEYIYYVVEVSSPDESHWIIDSIPYSQQQYLDGEVTSVLERKGSKNPDNHYRVMRHIVKEIENVPARTNRCPECGQPRHTETEKE